MNDLEFLSFVEATNSLDIHQYQYFNNLLNRRTIVFNSEIDEDIFEAVVLPLKEFEEDDSTSTITLYLNTPGGSVADALILCNMIDQYKKPLDIIVPSYACSMGTIILCAGNKNPNVTKKCYPFSFGLLHSGQTFVGGESHSVEDTVDFNKSIDVKIRDYIINNTNITKEIYDQHYRKQWYLDSAAMLEYGLVDQIIGSDS